MKNVQIRDVPEDIHALLTQRAAAEDKSLQVYLSEMLAREAKKQATENFFKSIVPSGKKSNITMDEIVEIIRADRDSR